MVEREEAVMAGLVVFMALLLLALLVLPSRTIGRQIWSFAETAYGLATSQTTTSTTSTSTLMTTTSTAKVTTTLKPTTTTLAKYPPNVSAAGPASSTSSTASTTTTTLAGKRCKYSIDCGGTVSTIGCKSNTIWNFTTVYTCMDGGSSESYCLGKQKEKPLLQCEIWQKCRNGTCIQVYDNECDYLCHQEDYDGYYCHDGSCPGADKQMALNHGSCSEFGEDCCCFKE